MELWRQLESVVKNRWVGAYWQSKGLTVIPTISWGGPRSFDFCFDGVEKHSIVAISTLGCRKEKLRFLRGYEEMCKKIEPEKIICYSTPFVEIREEVITVDYRNYRKEVK